MIPALNGRSRPYFQVTFLVGLLATIYLLRSSHIFQESEHLLIGEKTLADDGASWAIPYRTDSFNNQKIANTTLGFQSIFVLGLPDRLLKHDSMELGASITDLALTWIDGVQGGEMHPNSVPPSHDNPKGGWFTKDSEVGKQLAGVSFSRIGHTSGH